MKKVVLLFIIIFLICFEGFSQNWITDFSEAKNLSTSQQKKIVLVFSGSDWCGPCIKLDTDIWKSQEFIDYSEDHFIMLKSDFPRKKKNKLSEEQQLHNDELAEKYGAEFPLIVVLNSEGKALGRLGYKKNYSPRDYINHISAL